MRILHTINNRNRRRGVTLLIVLALMIMFAMLVITFMVITSQNRQTAETLAKVLIAEPPAMVVMGNPQPLPKHNWHFNVALKLLLTDDPHNILENLYGNPDDGLAGNFQTVPSSDGNLLQVAIPALPGYLEANVLGNVVTVQYPNSPLHNKSTLVFDVRPGDEQVYLVPLSVREADFDDDAEKTEWQHKSETERLKWQADTLSQPNCRLVFNAPPFSAAQFNAPQLSDGSVPRSAAYTAPDSALFLAWNDVSGGQLKRMIPSFHRTDQILRPTPMDNPHFTGSNPAASPSRWTNFAANGPWDVDNSGSGTHDGVWLDIGLPNQPDPQRYNSYYKPLVSYHVLDMDGYININTVGNLAQTAGDPPDRGMGMGPAELTSPLLPLPPQTAVLTEMLTGNSNHEGRYGTDKQPGGIDDDLLLNNGINAAAYTGGGLTADWFGISPITFDPLGNRKAPAVSALFNPYLMNPYNTRNGDEPFRAVDQETLLRSVIDIDYEKLPARLRDLLGDHFDATRFPASNLRYGLGTRSSTIPVSPPLYNRVLFLCGGNSAEANRLWMLLPEEIRRGGKVNLNRLTWRNDWMTGSTNNIQREALLIAKAQFAQELFYLLQVLFTDQAARSEASLERLAQWSVNFVDFIDPDDVMTPFIFDKSKPDSGSIAVMDKNVFNSMMGKVIGGTLTADDLKGTDADGNDIVKYALIWGFEKPEVVMTETFAFHNRGVVAIEDNNGSSSAFRQYLRPQGSLFVKLYRQGNEQRKYSASTLIDADKGTLNLAQRTSDRSAGDYVWRIAVGEAAKTTAGKFTWNDDDAPEKNALRQLLTPDDENPQFPQFYQWRYNDPDNEGAGEYHPDLGVPERFIWFGSGDIPKPKDDENWQRSFGQHTGSNPDNLILPPDTSLVVAPQAITYLGPPDASSVSINLSGVKTMFAVSLSDSGSATPATRLNVSEPSPPVSAYTSYQHDPNTPPVWTDPLPYDGSIAGTIPRQRGTVPCFKTICLQRLADPARPHDPIGNPYLTVDWSMIDLHVFNSVVRPNQNRLTEEGDIPKDNDMCFSSRQWTQSVLGFSNIWDRTLAKHILTGKAGLERTGYDDSGGTQGGLLQTAPKHTLGQSAPDKPLYHFPWNDAPLMNSGEMMLVPASAPGRFGVEFHDNRSQNFFGEKPRFGYRYEEGSTVVSFSPYLNWVSDPAPDASATDTSDMLSLFDYAHVPSRFAGTRTNPLGTSPGLVYREPGKINLNTITESGWNALANGGANGRAGFPSYKQFCDYRDKTWRTDGPFHSPMSVLVGLGMIDSRADNPYSALENLMRLSDVTTTQSNVFAVWITVGFFNVEPGGNVLGAERGLDDGTVRRYRMFYLIDRSTPVGYRRGEEMNTRNVIIQETQQLD